MFRPVTSKSAFLEQVKQLSQRADSHLEAVMVAFRKQTLASTTLQASATEELCQAACTLRHRSWWKQRRRRRTTAGAGGPRASRGSGAGWRSEPA